MKRLENAPRFSLLLSLAGLFLSADVLAAEPSRVLPERTALPPVPSLPSLMPPSFARPAATPIGNRGKRLGQPMECLLEPRLIAQIGSPVEGTIAEVLVERGSMVNRGDVLVRLNNAVETATVNLKRAQEEFGERKVARNEDLFSKQLISASEKDELETQTRLAHLERRQQEEVLNLRTIRSPMDGVVVERFLAPGDRVQHDKIMKIAQIHPLNVEVVAPVELFGSVRTGMIGEVSLAPLIKGRHLARVVVVDRVVDAASGTFGIRLELSNPDLRIPAGIECSVVIQ